MGVFVLDIATGFIAAGCALFGVSVGAGGILIKVGSLRESMATKEALTRVEKEAKENISRVENDSYAARNVMQERVLAELRSYVSKEVLELHLKGLGDTLLHQDREMRDFRKEMGLALRELKAAIDVRNSSNATNWGQNNDTPSQKPDR